MHIVIATPEYPPHAGGGILKFYRMLTPEYAKAGHRVTVLVANPFSPDFPGYEHDSVAVRCVPRTSIAKCAERLGHLSAAPILRAWLAAARALADASLEHAPDCIETTDFGMAFASLAVRRGRPGEVREGHVTCPLIVQMHGSLGQISEHEPPRGADALDLALARLLEAVLIPRADDVQAYSELNAMEWRRRLGRDVRFIPPPFVPSCDVIAGADSGAQVGVVVARIQPWKGPEVLCQAIERLSAAGDRPPKVVWVGRDTPTAAGGRSFDAYLRQKYPGTWGSTIEPVGQKPYDEVLALQSKARFVVVPSDWDTFNFSTAEAMAAGRVVVCSDGVGASSMIEDGVNGFLFAAGDPASLCHALRRTLDLTPSDAQRVGDAARAATTQLDPSKVARIRLEHACALASRHTEPRPMPPWVEEFVHAGADRVGDHGFLDSVSIRDLAHHLGSRLLRRLSEGRSR